MFTLSIVSHYKAILFGKSTQKYRQHYSLWGGVWGSFAEVGLEGWVGLKTHRLCKNCPKAVRVRTQFISFHFFCPKLTQVQTQFTGFRFFCPKLPYVRTQFTGFHFFCPKDPRVRTQFTGFHFFCPKLPRVRIILSSFHFFCPK